MTRRPLNASADATGDAAARGRKRAFGLPIRGSVSMTWLSASSMSVLSWPSASPPASAYRCPQCGGARRPGAVLVHPVLSAMRRRSLGDAVRHLPRMGAGTLPCVLLGRRRAAPLSMQADGLWSSLPQGCTTHARMSIRLWYRSAAEGSISVPRASNTSGVPLSTVIQDACVRPTSTPPIRRRLPASAATPARGARGARTARWSR